MTRPLTGIRVLDLTRLLPGPFCTQYLTQMGATVIKIEEPDGGDYARKMLSLFELINRGKRSVALDLRRAGDREAFKGLATEADVVVESFRPGVMDNLGCGYDTLKAINPRLVYAALTGYGQTGPYRDRAGHDANYLAYAGVLDQTGPAGGKPCVPGVQIADLAGGALTCAMGILAALTDAQRGGEGRFVDVSMMDGAMALSVFNLALMQDTGEVPARGKGPLTGAFPNYAIYRCRGGGYLMLGALEPKFFIAFLRAVKDSAPAPLRWPIARALAALDKPSKKGGEPRGDQEQKSDGSGAGGKPSMLDRLQRDPARAHRLLAPLRWAIAGVIRTRTRDQWARLLADADACVAPVLNLEEALTNEQAAARGMVERTNGKAAFGLPIVFSDGVFPGREREQLAPSPELGADTDAVLAEFGEYENNKPSVSTTIND